MAQLLFEYGAMNSGKSIEILKVAHNYESQDKRVLLLTPAIDTRDGVGVVASRIGLRREAQIIHDHEDIFELVRRLTPAPAVVLVDEAQFLAPQQVDQLAHIVDDCDIPVMTFGLKQDAFNHLFPGSQRLLEVADKLNEMKTICAFCGRKAITQLRLLNGVPQRSGEQIFISDDSHHMPTCRYHWHHPDQARIAVLLKGKK